jgi:hypothetical protein
MPVALPSDPDKVGSMKQQNPWNPAALERVFLVSVLHDDARHCMD